MQFEAIKKFVKEEEGQSMVEYGVVLGAVAAVAYIAVVVMGDRVADLYTWMANHLPGGEDDDLGQVRVTVEGLVPLNPVSGGEITWGDPDELQDKGMIDYLGSAAADD